MQRRGGSQASPAVIKPRSLAPRSHIPGSGLGWPLTRPAKVRLDLPRGSQKWVCVAEEQVYHCLLPPDTGDFGGSDKGARNVAYQGAGPSWQLVSTEDPPRGGTTESQPKGKDRTGNAGNVAQYSITCLAYTGPGFDSQHMGVG